MNLLHPDSFEVHEDEYDFLRGGWRDHVEEEDALEAELDAIEPVTFTRTEEY